MKQLDHSRQLKNSQHVVIISSSLNSLCAVHYLNVEIVTPSKRLNEAKVQYLDFEDNCRGWATESTQKTKNAR